MKRTLLFGTLMLAACLLSAAPFTIVHMTQTDIELAFELPDWHLQDAAGTGGQEIVVPGSISLADDGKPLVPYFAEAIGLPVDGSFTVTVSNLQEETVNGVNLRPAQAELDPVGTTTATRKDQRAYRSNALYPASLVDRGEAVFMGDRHFAALQVYPFRYNAARGQLRITTKATLHIHINGSTQPTPGWETTSAMLREPQGVFLNDTYARQWRKQPQPTTQATQTRNSQVQALQFVVDVDGLYKITYETLSDSIGVWQDSTDYSMAWNLDQLDPRYFALYDEHGVIPIHCEGEADGSFDPGDFIEFYGRRHAGDEGYYDEYTAENVYSLRLSDAYGARMAVENGGLEVNDPSLYTVPRAFEQTVHIEEQNIFARLGFFPDAPREDLYFWGSITSPSMEIIEFDLQYPYQSTIRGFTANVMLMGSTHLDSLPGTVADHHAEVRLNSAIIDNQSWFRQREKLMTNSNFISNSQLNHGTNSLYISLPGDIPGGFEQVMLDWLELKYWRQYKTDEDFIEFTKPSNQANGLFQFELDNFCSPDVSIYKIGASVLENMQIEPFSETGGAPWKVTFQDYVNSDDVTYFAVTESAKRQPKVIRMDIPSELRTVDHQANYIVITGQQFIGCEGLELLEQTWQQYGLEYTGENVQLEVVSVEDIFDEFSHGIRDAQAIRDFLDFAYNNWNYGGTTGRVKNVLLLGEGNRDTRDNAYYRYTNIIPVKMVWTYKHGATAADNWYTAVVGADPVGDINIGRICLWTEEQILAVANKIRHYIEEPMPEDLWHGSLTFAAGGKPSDGTDIFAQQSENIRKYAVPERYRVTRVYTYTSQVSPYFQGNTFTLLDQFSNGTNYIQFLGHGGGQIWSDYNLFHWDDIEALDNDKYPFVVSLACFCSLFEGDGVSCIGEGLVLAEDKGGIGHLGFSGMGYKDQDEDYGLFLNELLFTDNVHALGQAVTYTKALAYAYLSGPSRVALLQGSVYIGDPLIRVRVPEVQEEVTLSKYNVQEGDTLTVTATFPPGVNTAYMRIVDEDDVLRNTPYGLPVIDGVLQQTYVVPNQTGDVYERRVKVYGGSTEFEADGMTLFTVGRTAVMDVATLPLAPSETDSVRITAQFYDEDGIGNITCEWQSSTNDTGNTRMEFSQDLECWVAADYVPPQPTGALISFRFTISNQAHNEYTSEWFSYNVTGPDLKIHMVSLTQEDAAPALEILVLNNGEVTSPDYMMELYQLFGDESRPLLLQAVRQPGIEPLVEERYTLPLPTATGNLRLRLMVNREHEFTEPEYVENSEYATYTVNMIALGAGQSSLSSLDGNLDCTFPTGVIPEGTIAYVDQTTTDDPLHQPGIEPIDMAYGGASIAYDVGLLDDTVFADSTGLLPGGATMRLSFHFEPVDSLGSQWADTGTFGVYRWNDEYAKWIYQGGQVSKESGVVVKDVKRCGIYAAFRNQDEMIPNIDANVEEQEFSYGGYVSGTGTISFILTDENGIDVVDNPPVIYLDGKMVPMESLSLSASRGQLINVPIKYQLDLDKGDYTLIISCSDVNGNYTEKHIPFIVNTEFGIINLANYPNPVLGVTIEPVNEGRTRFTYVLTDDADNVNLKVYTVTGRLVKTFRNLPTAVGYHEYPRTVYGWDCRDDEGKYLANGVYFYRLTATRNGKEVQKIQKMAILR